MSGDVTPYLNLITSQHADKPKFTAMVAAVAQPFADLTALYSSFSALYDIDQASGKQLDVLGQWLGASRTISAPITVPYFAFDMPGYGFDQGAWDLSPSSSTTKFTLADLYYRLLLKVRVLNDMWDASIPMAYSLAEALFASFGYVFAIEDNGNLTMNMVLIGTSTPNAMIEALMKSGAIDVRPIGVQIANYLFIDSGGPIFALDLSSAAFGGLDVGSWAV